MNNEQLRHWLAMHCPPTAAGAIFNDLSDYRQNKSFFERHGVRLTIELCRYVWADRMIEASAVQIIEAEEAGR